MRTIILTILYSLTLSVYAQSQTTITISSSNDFNVEYEDCAVDTVECDTVAMESLISADTAFSLAKQYESQGKSIEMVLALYQSWLLGNMEQVDSYISGNKEIQKALSFMMFFDNVPNGDSKKILDFLTSTIPDNDTEIRLLADIIKYKFEGTDQFKALEVFRTETYKKHKNNPFYKYLNAIIEYDDTNEFKCVVQSFNEMKALADEEIELAYSELARKYAIGSGTEKDKEKAREYFIKTIDAGILSKHDAQQFLYFLNDNPDIFVSDEHRVHLIRTISISLPYWLNIQKRLNNLKTI